MDHSGSMGREDRSPASAEVRRLEKELHDLLSSGGYTPGDALVLQLKKHLEMAKETERLTKSE